eukprot:Gb_13436 [translate_table: standard]
MEKFQTQQSARVSILCRLQWRLCLRGNLARECSPSHQEFVVQSNNFPTSRPSLKIRSEGTHQPSFVKKLESLPEMNVYLEAVVDSLKKLNECTLIGHFSRYPKEPRKMQPMQESTSKQSWVWGYHMPSRLTLEEQDQPRNEDGFQLVKRRRQSVPPKEAVAKGPVQKAMIKPSHQKAKGGSTSEKQTRKFNKRNNKSLNQFQILENINQDFDMEQSYRYDKTPREILPKSEEGPSKSDQKTQVIKGGSARDRLDCLVTESEDHKRKSKATANPRKEAPSTPNWGKDSVPSINELE